MSARKRVAIGRPPGGKFPQGYTGKTRDRIGKFAGVSGRTVEKIAAVCEAAKADPIKFGWLRDDMDRTGRVDGLYKRLRTMQQAEAQPYRSVRSRGKKTHIEELAEGVTIYLGDCREILPTLKNVGVLVSDPPYGNGHRYGQHYRDKGGDAYSELIRALEPWPRCLLHFPEETMRYFVPLFGPPDECFTWCYSSNQPRQSRLFSFWNLDVDFSRALVPARNPTDRRVPSFVRSQDWTSEFEQVKNVSSEKTEHPCQVPVGLMERVLSFIKCKSVTDPFLGSGTTGAAAVKLGRKFAGIEIEPKFFDIACRRISAALNCKERY